MGKVIYSMGVSLDGYIEDASGGFAFAAPDEEMHRLANEHARQASAFLFGRRLYELMEGAWPAAVHQDDLPDVEAEFARIYVETPRIVFSDTLERVAERARLVRSGDAVAEVTRLKEESDGNLDLGGAGLAASLIDLVDEVRLFVAPVAVGGGKPFLPQRRERLDLRLCEHRTFATGAVYLRYERRR
jgi:dihydrofolate reductase